MNAITKVEAQKPMLLEGMASKYGLLPQEFANTVRATCGLAKASPEEFAALVMVAKEYGLNPLLKEIYAFPARGGGIVPIVSIDGWVNLVNSHPKCDGFTFEMEHDANGNLVACTCRMHRKDRTHPVEVTEYLDECKRATEPWKMQHRMLRHKAMIQAARYAFGFSGIYDEDEGAKIAEMRDVTPASPPSLRPPSLAKPVGQVETIDHREVVEETGEATEVLEDANPFDLESFLSELDQAMATGKDPDQVIEIWDGFDVEATLCEDGKALQRAFDMRADRIASFSTINAG